MLSHASLAPNKVVDILRSSTVHIAIDRINKVASTDLTLCSLQASWLQRS